MNAKTVKKYLPILILVLWLMPQPSQMHFGRTLDNPLKYRAALAGLTYREDGTVWHVPIGGLNLGNFLDSILQNPTNLPPLDDWELQYIAYSSQDDYEVSDEDNLFPTHRYALDLEASQVIFPQIYGTPSESNKEDIEQLVVRVDGHYVECDGIVYEIPQELDVTAYILRVSDSHIYMPWIVTEDASQEVKNR